VRIVVGLAIVLAIGCGKTRSVERQVIGVDASSQCGSGDDPCPGQLTTFASDGTILCVDPDCRIDAECSAGLVCSPLTGACVEPPDCDDNADCPSGERCIAGACEPTPPCDEHTDCPGEVCIAGVCGPQPTCDDSSDCPAGWSCFDAQFGQDVCVPDNQTCEDGCVAPFACKETAPAPEPLPQAVQQATAQCEPIVYPCDETCTTGVCENGACALCESDLDCAGTDAGSAATSRRCEAGYCVAVEPTPIMDAGIDPPVNDAGSGSIATAALASPLVADGTARQRPADPTKFAGALDVLVLPPPDVLDFSTPIKLITTALAAVVRGKAHVRDGKAKLEHPIGHLHVTMSCTNGNNQALRIPFTGMTSGGGEYEAVWHNAKAALGGTGALLYPFPPKLDEGNAIAQQDVETRRNHPGMVGIIRIPLDDWQCRDLALYYDAYKKRLATMKYDSQARPRRFEGAGCTAFGVTFIERTRTVKRSYMVDNWAQQFEIGLSTIGSPKKFLNTFASDQYPYGSNLVAWIGGQWKRWPKNAPVGGRGVLQLADLDRWVNGNETAVPLTLFDTAPMFAYINAVHNGRDADMWDTTTESNGNVKVIVRKRSCDEVLPKNPDDDDLRRDN
jgi:hypothetical protein